MLLLLQHASRCVTVATSKVSGPDSKVVGTVLANHGCKRYHTGAIALKQQPSMPYSTWKKLEYVAAVLSKSCVSCCCRAGTLAIAGDLGGLRIANTGTGTVFTSGLASAAAAAVSGSGKTILIPTGGEAHFSPSPTVVPLFASKQNKPHQEHPNQSMRSETLVSNASILPSRQFRQ